MKDLLEKGLIYLVVAAVVAVASIGVAIVAFVFIMTAIGNLAWWPMVGSLIIGKPLSFGEALLGGAVLLIAIIAGLNFLPHKTERFLEWFGIIWVTGMMAVFLAFVLGSLAFALGMPFHYFATNVLKIDLPLWSALPMGIAAYLAWAKLRPQKNG